MGGAVLAEPSLLTGQSVDLTEGSVTFLAEDGTLLAEAVQASPGFWQAVLPPTTPYRLRVEAEGARPTLFAGASPSWSGLWFTGAVFAAPVDLVDPFFADVAEVADVPPPAQADAVQVWLRVVDDVEAERLDPGRVRVIGGDGVEVPVVGLFEDPAGLLVTDRAPAHEVLAFDVPAGEVRVIVEGPGGASVDTRFLAEPGEIVAPWFLVVP